MARQRIETIDYEGFAREIFAIREDMKANLGPADFHHLRRLIWINRLFCGLGYATAWIFPNPLSALCISLGITGRWMVMHHVGHGGYDKVPGAPKRYHSKRFAMGWRRFVDWFDWILPDAWNYEHNVLHHYHTGEQNDPDLVEDHAEFARKANWPMPFKYFLAFLLSISWKFSYYAPNTLLAQSQKGRKAPTGDILGVIWENAFDPRNPNVRKLWLKCYLPYIVWAFLLLPLLYWPLGTAAVLSVLINRLLAEAITNFHTFAVIAPNHAGDDLYRYEAHFKGKEEFAVNQVLGSCNFHCGSELVDYSQKYLNYQIEHHLFPHMPLLKYRQYQPRVKAVCQAYGVQYVQESVFKRCVKLVDIMVGKTSMNRLGPDGPVEVLLEDFSSCATGRDAAAALGEQDALAAE